MKIKLLMYFLLAVLFFSCDSKDPLYGLNDEQKTLANEKKVSIWPKDDKTLTPSEDLINVNLTDSECERLGGTIKYHQWCGKTRLKCVVGDRAICIDKIVLPPN